MRQSAGIFRGLATYGMDEMMRLNAAIWGLGLLALHGCDGDGHAISDAQVAPVPTRVLMPRAQTPIPASIAEPSELIELPPDQPTDPSPELEADEEDYIEPEPELAPQAPPGYGQINPPDPVPDAAALTQHALVGYEVVAVYSKPDKTSPRLGYMRLGTRLRATAKVAGKGCSGGWYGLPKGGYACSGKGGGLVVDAKREPYMHRVPPSPRMDEAMPYEYALVRKWNTPMYWRVPTTQEQEVAGVRRTRLEARREGKPLPGDVATVAPAPAEAPAATPPPTPPPTEPVPKADAEEPTTGVKADATAERLGALPKPPAASTSGPTAKSPGDPDPAVATAPGKAGAAAPAPGKTSKSSPAGSNDGSGAQAADSGSPSGATEAEVEPIKLPLNPQTPWLEKGFYISLADQIEENGARWWRTARGGYVAAGGAVKIAAKGEHHGYELDIEADFPFGYAMAKSPQLVELTEDGKLRVAQKIPRRTFVDLADETEIAGRAYMVTTEGLLIRKDHVRFAERQPIPEGIQPWERWIDVDLTKQLLVAYEGERPVFTTLVSTGRKGTKEEPFETPTGRWRIRSKHVTTTMDGPTASDGNYSIQDVPWTMYFYDSYALHGAFWHDGFGRVRSHGCVNLGPTDARWLFNWTTPFLPEGWHGVHAHEGSPGTTIVVRKSEK